jgi:hypothetical protein
MALFGLLLQPPSRTLPISDLVLINLYLLALCSPFLASFGYFGAMFAVFCNDNLYSPRDCFIIFVLFYNLRFILSLLE